MKIPDVSVESITKQFCYNNVIFGNALKDIESREQVRHFLGAMTDLAEILNLDICTINQLGKLDINFATMGSAGAMATYYPSRKAINLTKNKGDGSVGHEWFHYVDNVIQEGAERKGSTTLASEVARSTDTGVKYAIYLLNQYIQKGDSENKAMVTKRFEAQDKIKYHAYGDTLEQCISNIQKMYSTYRKASRAKEKTVAGYFGFLAHKFGKEYIDVAMELDTTMFYYNSANMGTAYWVKPEELLARAFEAYIEYILALDNRKNNYLVSYKNNFIFSDLPYPEGRELEKIVLLYDNVFKEFKKQFNIPDFKPFTTERENEYIDLKIETKSQIKDVAKKPDWNKLIAERKGISEEEAKELLSKPLKKDYEIIDVTPEGYGIEDAKPDKKQQLQDRLDLINEMIADESDNNKKQELIDRSELITEMISEF